MPKLVNKQAGNPNDPHGLYCYMQRYLEYLGMINRTPAGIYNVHRYLIDFIAWCDVRNLRVPQEITKAILQRYQKSLYYYRQPNGKPLSFRTQATKLVPVRGWFKWLAEEDYIPFNPAGELRLPKIPKSLPKEILSTREVERLMTQPNIETPVGLRDRAMLELVYSTGIRRMEVGQLKVYDIDFERRTLFIREGKYQKQRLLPVGDRALLWLRKYLDDARPQLIRKVDDMTVFVARYGGEMNDTWMSSSLRKYFDHAGITKAGTLHILRHSMATHMLDNGADIRFIQAMLGHAELSTTEIYTQVSIKKLRQVHEQTHPARLPEKDREKESADEMIERLFMESLEGEL
jgi:integrase/recombinase XerD